MSTANSATSADGISAISGSSPPCWGPKPGHNSTCAAAVTKEPRRASRRLVPAAWFNPTKGYGLIQPQGGGKVVFVHISAVGDAKNVDFSVDVEVHFLRVFPYTGAALSGESFGRTLQLRVDKGMAG